MFNARIGGNFINTDILGSLEFACKVSGAKLILLYIKTYHRACILLFVITTFFCRLLANNIQSIYTGEGKFKYCFMRLSFAFFFLSFYFFSCKNQSVHDQMKDTLSPVLKKDT